MSSGRQLGEQNLVCFVTWVASKTDEDFRAMAHMGVLSRTEVAKECGFAKSVLRQNPRIKLTLSELEDDLRIRGVLPPIAERRPEVSQVPLMRELGQTHAARDTERLRRLEQENASLKAEVAELKCKLAKYAVLRDALAMTGRMPR